MNYYDGCRSTPPPSAKHRLRGGKHIGRTGFAGGRLAPSSVAVITACVFFVLQHALTGFPVVVLFFILTSRAVVDARYF